MPTALSAMYLLGRIQKARELGERRIAAFQAKYAPIIAALSETEWMGLVEAVGAEIETRGPADASSGRLLRESMGRLPRRETPNAHVRPESRTP